MRVYGVEVGTSRPVEFRTACEVELLRLVGSRMRFLDSFRPTSFLTVILFIAHRQSSILHPLLYQFPHLICFFTGYTPLFIPLSEYSVFNAMGKVHLIFYLAGLVP